jgi:PAS domain S-box-containing protein
VFVIASKVFKFFKVSYEKNIKIYDYMPLYWRHIPIGSILFAVLVGGLFFSIYLENHSRGNIEKSSKAVVSAIAESVSSKLSRADKVSLALSKTPFVKESMSNPSPANKTLINNMFEDYCKTFGVLMIFTVDNDGRVVFYSEKLEELALLETNMKHRPYFTEAQSMKHGSVFVRNLSGARQSYFSSDTIDGANNDAVGIIVVQEDIDDVISKLKQYRDIFVADENGMVFLSDKDDAYFSYLWPLYNDASGKRTGLKNILLREVFDGETVVLSGKTYHVSRQFIGRKGWSVIHFSSLNPIKQFKLLSIAVVCGTIIIILLLFLIINQSSRIFALALQHKAILNSAKSIIIVATDAQGNIIVYGQGAEDILGYTQKEFIEKGLGAIAFTKEGRSVTFEESVMYSSMPSTEILCRCKDGSLITMLISVLPQYSLGNKLIGYIFSGADITTAKDAEVELAHQIKFLQMLIDSMPTAVYYKDSDMHLIGCNKAFEDIMEHPKDFIIGKLDEHIYFDKTAGEESALTDAVAAKKLSSITYEKVVKFRKSPLRNLVYYKSAYRKIDGKFGGIIGIILDVTQERRMQSERDALQANMIQQNKLASLGELAGSIAHELNNPLSIILGFAQVLIKDASLNDEAKKGIGNIYEAAKRSKSIITNMLEFARSDTSKNQMANINDIIDSTMLIIEKDFNKAGIEIQKILTHDAKSIIINPMQIQQVLLNMLLNSKDAMPSGGKITVQTHINDKYFMINISDDGSGIPREIIPRIFEPFFTTKSIGKGTGLGLSICYGIIKAHKGNISVKSTVNKGTVFTIKLPLPALAGGSLQTAN